MTPTAPLSIAYAHWGGGASTISIPPVLLSAKPAVVYPSQFVAPDTDALMLVSFSRDASTTWSVSGNAVVLSTAEPDTLSLGGQVPTAPPGAIFLKANASGTATVTATSGGQTASLQVNAYGSLSIGCGLRYAAAVNFDPDRAGTQATPITSSDLYATETASGGDPFDPCPALGLGAAVRALHAPYGGTMIPVADLQAFAAITATQWKNDGTTFTPNGGALVYKTAEGRIVKAMLPVGPAEVSDQNGVFPF
jgi:hypothetical protein